MTAPVELSVGEARRIALAAQGLFRRRPVGRPDRRHLRGVLDRIGLLQIDSVNVLVRSHYLPLFSRLGSYPPDLLDRTAYRHRELFEYWGHQASLLPVALQPLLRWRMERTAADGWRGWAHDPARRPVLDVVLAEVAERGPLSASELADPGANSGPWWGWSHGKSVLEYLFATGKVTVATRRGFERVYDLPERVLPAEVLTTPTPSEGEARRELLRIASRAHGVGTARDLADYFRLKGPDVRRLLADLVAEGELVAAQVEGWRQPAFLHPEARAPRRVDGRALLSPFDPVVWERDRAERLFGFSYRIEIYTPAPKRRFGYYVLPFLLGDELVARVDLKADRRQRRLLVQAAHLEAGCDPGRVAEGLAAELGEMASWLGLEAVAVGRRGGLAAALGSAVRASSPADPPGTFRN